MLAWWGVTPFVKAAQKFMQRSFNLQDFLIKPWIYINDTYSASKRSILWPFLLSPSLTTCEDIQHIREFFFKFILIRGDRYSTKTITITVVSACSSCQLLMEHEWGSDHCFFGRECTWWKDKNCFQTKKFPQQKEVSMDLSWRFEQ